MVFFGVSAFPKSWRSLDAESWHDHRAHCFKMICSWSLQTRRISVSAEKAGCEVQKNLGGNPSLNPMIFHAAAPIWRSCRHRNSNYRI